MIYKLLLPAEWAALRAEGRTDGAPIDLADGYIHFSTAAQVAETAAKYFAGVERLTLLSVDPAPLGEALRWEPARDGALFPHLYRELRMADVAAAIELPLDGGTHRFPALA